MSQFVALALVYNLSLPGLPWPGPRRSRTSRPPESGAGEPAEVIVSGAGLAGNPRLIAPFASRTETVKGTGAGSWKLELTVDPSSRSGSTRSGSRPMTGSPIRSCWRSASSRRSSRRRRTAPSRGAADPDLPLVIEGKVAGNDVDFFRFQGQRGRGSSWMPSVPGSVQGSTRPSA